MTSLSLALLGPLRLHSNGRSLTGIESQKGEALLAYLAVTAGQTHKRKSLALLLWPDKPAGAGRKNLRQALYNLRRALPTAPHEEKWLHVTRQEIRFSPSSALWVDVHQFRAIMAHVKQHNHPAPHACPDCVERLQTAVDLYRGEFLAGFSLPDSDAFDQWQMVQRETYHTQMMRALSHLAVYRERQGEHDAAIRVLRRQVEMEPWREEAQQQLMRLLAQNGRRAAALHQYEQYARYLSETLDAAPGEALTDLYHKIEAGAPLAAPVGAQNPYRGLDPFTADQAAFFFGREAAVDQLRERLEQAGLVSVVGPSGSGKSSLIQAGLLPCLAAPDAAIRWVTAVFRPGEAPVSSLAETLVRLDPEQDLSEATIKEMETALHEAETTLPAVAAGILRRHVAAADDERPARLLLVVDQFEELYTLTTDAAERRRFIDLLLQTAVSPPLPCRLILNLRADFTSQALDYRPLADAMQATGGVALGPMTRRELTHAIVAPARLQGVTFEPGLPARLLADVGEGPGRLPLLSFTLRRLWQAGENGRLTHAAYEALGQVGGAISHYANQVYADLAPHEQRLAQRIFTHLVQPGRETADTRRPATRAELGEQAWQIIPTLVAARLIVSGRSSRGEETVELIHEALITHWDRLRRWLDRDKAFYLWRQRLRTLRRHWQESGRDEGALLQGAPLTEAESWLEQRAAALSAADREFITVSLARRQAEARAEAKRRERELAQARALAAAEKARANTEAGARRRLGAFLAIAAAFFLVASLAAVYAATQRNEAQAQAQLAAQAQATAEAERLLADAEAGARATEVAIRSTAEAVAAAEADARAAEVAVRSTAEAQALAAGDLLEAERRVAEQQARLSHSAQLVAESRLVADTQPVRSLLLAVAANDALQPGDPYRPGAVQALRDALQDPLGRPLGGFTDEVKSEAIDPTGAWLAASEAGGRILLWSLPDLSQPPRELLGHTGNIRVMTFSPDGEWLATASADGAARLWPIRADGAGEPYVLDEHDAEVEDVQFSPDGAWLATGSRDETARLWSVADPEAPLRVLAGEEGWIWKVAFSPDGQWLATGSFDGFIRFWSLTDEEAEPLVVKAHDIWIRALRFSPDGRWLISGGAFGLVKMWPATDLVAGAAPEPRVLAGHENHVIDIEFSPDGETFATGSIDTTARLWSLADPTTDPVVLRGHAIAVKDIEFSPDGETLATAGADGAARLWSTADPQTSPRILHGHDDHVNHVVFTPDGRRLVTVSNDALVRLWPLDDAATAAREPRLLRGHNDVVMEMGVTSDGAHLISAGADGTVRIWDMLRETPSILHTFQHESGVATLALSPDEQWLATVTISETVQIWPLGDGATGVETGDVQPPLIQGPAQETWNLKPFSAGGQWLVSGAPDGAVYLWPIGENPATEPRIFAHEGAVVDAEVSPDGRWLVAAGGSPNHTATVWSLTGEDNGDAYVLDGYEDQVWDAAFSPDGSLLATASWDGAARLYRVPHFDAPPTILQRVARPMTIARFSPDGKWLAAASHTLWLWPAGDLDAEPIVLSGHQNEIKDFAFGPNEAWVVTASWDQTVRLWNLNAPDAGAQVLRDHDDRVAGVVFDPNGRWIASVGEKSAVIRLWRVRDDALIELACARAGRGLTRGEWARYFRADQPYQPVCS